jgi:hypothetical protein
VSDAVRIIDNAIDDQSFNHLESIIMGEHFHWSYTETVANDAPEFDGYFTNTMYHYGRPFNDYFDPIMNVIEPYMDDIKSLMRLRAIMFTRTADIIEYQKHSDFDFSHKGFLVYMNTNNGFTRLDDGSKVDSVRNRILHHDASIPHNSSSTSDKARRVALVANYF